MRDSASFYVLSAYITAIPSATDSVKSYTDTATAGSRMPVSVGHTYNSCQCLSDDFGCGLGWRLSLNQTLRRETILSTAYYIWRRISVTFPVTASASGTSFNIRFQSNAKSGTVWFAAPQVEKGDIVGLIDNTGATVVEYKYDAWGNPISTRTLTSEYDALAELNPFRYRGYVWDADTEQYYVSSHYFKPKLIRWSNADGYVSTGQGFIGCNMYAYCNNSPLILKDSSGHRAQVSYEELSYDSADEAAIAFYEEVQSICLYVHHEFGTYIYSRTIGNITTYGYMPPVVGQPHNISISDLFVPKDGKIVALAHTHWETDTFSGMDSREEKGDLVMVRNTNYDMYVVGPSLQMYKYCFNTREVGEEPLATIEIASLTYDEKYITYYTLANNWNIHRSVCEQCQKYEEINLIPEG